MHIVNGRQSDKLKQPACPVSYVLLTYTSSLVPLH